MRVTKKTVTTFGNSSAEKLNRKQAAHQVRTARSHFLYHDTVGNRFLFIQQFVFISCKAGLRVHNLASTAKRG